MTGALLCMVTRINRTIESVIARAVLCIITCVNRTASQSVMTTAVPTRQTEETSQRLENTSGVSKLRLSLLFVCSCCCMLLRVRPSEWPGH